MLNASCWGAFDDILVQRYIGHRPGNRFLPHGIVIIASLCH